MVKRILIHIIFWMLVIAFIALVKSSFPSTSDRLLTPIQIYGKTLFEELVFLPTKIIPFYFLFYFLLPRYSPTKKIQAVVYFALCISACIACYRLLITPVSYILYNDTPTFNVFSWNRLLYTLLDILPFLAVGSVIKLVKIHLDEKDKAAQIIQEKLETELKFLKAQTNPHFLFNTLNNIYGLARKNDINTASSVMKLSQIMRYLLYRCNENEVSLDEEIEVIQHYITLEQLRYTDRLKVAFDYKNEIGESIKIAPLILLPFVENAFKHGISESRFEAFIHIKLTASIDKIIFGIQNSYDEIEDQKSGIGLSNVNRQLQLIYPNLYKLHRTYENGIHSIMLTINLRS